MYKCFLLKRKEMYPFKKETISNLLKATAYNECSSSQHKLCIK